MLPLPWLCSLLAYGLLASNPPSSIAGRDSTSSSSSSSSSRLGFFWRTSEAGGVATTTTNYENSDDPDFPWIFTGRALLCPMLIRLPQNDDDESKNLPYNPWSLFGWTVGGIVALEYDESPVGSYIEYVELGCLASLLHPSHEGKRFLVGQVGSKLFVNEKKALTLCDAVWNLKAQKATREIVQSHGEAMSTFFENTKFAPTIPFRSLPLWWTPTITSIWAQLLPLLPQSKTEPALPLNKLRVSGKAKLVPRIFSQEGKIPMGIGIAVRDVLIEISPQVNNGEDQKHN